MNEAMIDLSTWSEQDRRNLFLEIDNSGFDVPEIAREAAARYRDEHGYFPHPGRTHNTDLIRIMGFSAEPSVLTIRRDEPFEYLEPKAVEKTFVRKIFAAKTDNGTTSILTRYFGHGISSSPGWVEV